MTEKIIKYSFYTLFFLTPLFFTKYNHELFEYNKMMLVYGLTVIITGFWILRMVGERALILKATPLDIPLMLFLASQILSTIFSIDPHTSIWGYYSRSNGGLLSIISYTLLFYAYVANFRKEEVFLSLKVLLFGGLVVSLYAIPEHFGFSPSCLILAQQFSASCWVQDVQARVFGTIGQPNWLAAYLSMLIFPAIYLFLEAKTKFSRIGYWLLIIAYYLAFTFTYSRGASLGLLAGFAVYGLGIGFQKLKLFSFVTATLILLNLLFGSALTQFRLIKDPAIPARPGLAQSSGTQLENGGTESGKIRLIVWKGALDIFRAYPLFGSGVETFAYAYYQFRPSEHNLVSEWDFLYNKAHNEYLNYLATTGAFGFGTYLIIIITFIILVLKKLGNSDGLLPVSLLAGYLSYLVQNFFLFSVVIIAVLFFLYPAFAFVFAGSSKELSEKNIVAKDINYILGLLGRKKILRKIIQILIMIIILISLNSLFSLWLADTYYKKGTDYNDLGNPGRAYNYLIEAVSLNSREPLYLAELGNAAASSAIALSTEDATTSGELKDDSVFFTDLALSISPSNTTILRTAIRTFFQLSLIDPEFEAKTLEVVDRSIALAPTDPKLLLNKAVILTQLEKPNQAIHSLKKAIELKSNYREARLNLADLYIKIEEFDLAKEQIDTILKMIPGDPDAIKLMEGL